MQMQQSAQSEVCDRIARVWERLAHHYGRPVIYPNGDPMAELVGTILSQHTTDASAAKAYAALRARYPKWHALAAASLDELAEVIRPAGLPVQKARAIQAALTEIGSDDLRSLAKLPVPEARARLTAIRGIGDKTASCVLLFALGMPAQPVDTHIERVCKRVGITGGASSATGIQHVLERCLPADAKTMYAFHVDIVRHGREICQARAPKCERCALTALCAYYARVTHTELPGAASQFEVTAGQ